MTMEFVEEGTLLAGRGLEGDRYCEHRGTYSVLRASARRPGEREPGRQITLIGSDDLPAAFARRGLDAPANWGDLRRNVVVRGVSADDLLRAVGRVVTLGDDGCRVLVHRHCVPCGYNERRNGVPGMAEAIWREAGVSCEILSGGRLRVGDRVTMPSFDDNDDVYEVDGGAQSPGFYLPPSKRSAEMVRAAIKMQRENKKKLTEIDPEGVQRAQDSYASVGLTFWPPDR